MSWKAIVREFGIIGNMSIGGEYRSEAIFSCIVEDALKIRDDTLNAGDAAQFAKGSMSEHEVLLCIHVHQNESLLCHLCHLVQPFVGCLAYGLPIDPC